ncbi:MAG: aerotolerance regulator BatB [Flammeovirgaceae bacterium]|nr:aerotolerance regulator BatB [Flammeovirgaceae bacterium]
MNFLKPFGSFEIIIILCFITLYSIYFVRLVKINKKIKVNKSKAFYKFILRSTYLSLMIIALLGPSFGENKEEIDLVGKDIMILVDLSESMNANDVKPSRLEKVKFEMKKVIDEFSSDRIGIIMFSGEAFVQCPMTYDKNALNLFTETLNTGLVPNTGTDFGPPLELSLSKLNNENAESNELSSKIILLISDGEDFGDNTKESLEKIVDSNIKLFTVGIGSEKGSKILLTNGDYKRDKEGKEVITKLDPISLKESAKETGGRYFEITNTNNQIDELIYEINNIKGEVIESKIIDVTENKYFYFLLTALILMIIDFTINLKIIRI